jgi:hypothetical protein
MITYTIKETKKAILKTIPIGTRISHANFEEMKWLVILNDGFNRQGWLTEQTFFSALGLLREDEIVVRHRNSLTRERFWVRVK